MSAATAAPPSTELATAIAPADRSSIEPRDYRLERPWEGPAERAERYGPLIEPEPGEWGGAG